MTLLKLLIKIFFLCMLIFLSFLFFIMGAACIDHNSIYLGAVYFTAATFFVCNFFSTVYFIYKLEMAEVNQLISDAINKEFDNKE